VHDVTRGGHSLDGEELDPLDVADDGDAHRAPTLAPRRERARDLRGDREHEPVRAQPADELHADRHAAARPPDGQRARYGFVALLSHTASMVYVPGASASPLSARIGYAARSTPWVIDPLGAIVSSIGIGFLRLSMKCIVRDAEPLSVTLTQSK